MATTKTTKKTAARKPAAEKVEAEKVETERPSFDMPDMDEVNERFDGIATDIVKFWRDATYTSVGVPLMVQERIAERDTSTISYTEFVEQSKAKGEVRVTEIQDRFEPMAQRFVDQFEPVAERIEARLPDQVKEAIEASRDRMRHVLDA